MNKSVWSFLILIVLPMLACTTETQPPAAPVDTPTPLSSRGEVLPAPSPTRVPQAPDAPTSEAVKELQMGPALSLPREWGLIIGSGCTSCDGPTEDLVRVYRDGNGQLRKESLVNGKNDLPKVSNLGAEVSIASSALASGGGRIAVAWAWAGVCGLADGCRPGAKTALLESVDGGVTWRESARFRAPYYTLEVTRNRILLLNLDTLAVRTTRPDAPPPSITEFLFNGRSFTAPAGMEFARPLFLEQSLVWLMRDQGLFDEDGSPLVLFGLPLKAEVITILPHPSGNQYALSWQEPAGQFRAYVGLMDAHGQLLRRFSASGLSLGAWLDGTRVVGNCHIRPGETGPWSTPCVIDLMAGTIQKLPETSLA